MLGEQDGAAVKLVRAAASVPPGLLKIVLRVNWRSFDEANTRSKSCEGYGLQQRGAAEPISHGQGVPYPCVLLQISPLSFSSRWARRLIFAIGGSSTTLDCRLNREGNRDLAIPTGTKANDPHFNCQA